VVSGFLGLSVVPIWFRFEVADRTMLRLWGSYRVLRVRFRLCRITTVALKTDGLDDAVGSRDRCRGFAVAAAVVLLAVIVTVAMRGRGRRAAE
jgi:hypothetical protein